MVREAAGGSLETSTVAASSLAAIAASVRTQSHVFREPTVCRCRRRIVRSSYRMFNLKATFIHEIAAEIMQVEVQDLVTVPGQFDPKLVKTAPSGERPED
jgi:hypothetical protein